MNIEEQNNLRVERTFLQKENERLSLRLDNSCETVNILLENRGQLLKENTKLKEEKSMVGEALIKMTQKFEAMEQLMAERNLLVQELETLWKKHQSLAPLKK